MTDQEISQQLRAIRNKFMSSSSGFLSKVGLTRIEFDVLNHIFIAAHNKEEVTASSLAKCYEVSIPAVMHKLEALENKQFIEKYLDPKDKRIKYYRLTKKTKQGYEGLFAKQEKRVESYLRALGEEREHLIKILEITLKYLEESYD